jgi:hypothetical protein
MSAALDWALAYARAGLPVLPLKPRTKVPATAHGKDDATCDLDAIRSWWRRLPDANVGARPPEGFVVIDVDPRNGGDRTLDELQRRHGPLPRTWAAVTGSDGYHIWLRCPGPYRASLGEGIDVKHHTGYLVMPPSTHPCGGRYEWAADACDTPIAWAPPWLRPLLAPPQRRHLPQLPHPASPSPGRAAALADVVAQAAAGNRNKALYWAAAKACADGILDQARPQLRAAALAAGLDEAETDRTLASAERSPRR